MFKLKFYGKLHEEYPQVVVGTGQAPVLVIAEHPDNGKEIVLFDGGRHGYNAMFCDEYADTEINGRQAATYYRDEQGQELFSIDVSIYNHHFYHQHALPMATDVSGTLLNGLPMEV